VGAGGGAVGGGGGGIDQDLYRYLRLFVPDLRFEFETLYVRYRFSRSQLCPSLWVLEWVVCLKVCGGVESNSK